MSITTRMILAVLARKAKTFEKSTEDPVKTQEDLLLDYLSRNKNTEYGRKYNFDKIKSISDYQKMVPMTDCDILHPYLDRVAKGEKNVLTSENPVFFGITSGTTARPKLIPVTKFSKSKKEELMNLWGY